MNMQYLDNILCEYDYHNIDEVIDAVKLSLPASYRFVDMLVFYENWTCRDNKSVIDIEAINVFYRDDKGEVHTEYLKTDIYDVKVKCDAKKLELYEGWVSAINKLL